MSYRAWDEMVQLIAIALAIWGLVRLGDLLDCVKEICELLKDIRKP